MCNTFEQSILWKAYQTALEAAGLGSPASETEEDLPPRPLVRIRDTAAVVRAAGNGAELVPMRWGFPAQRPRGGPVFNFRSEGRRFDKAQRCLIPISAFYEFTGTKSPKQRWRFTWTGAPFMCMAGIWRGDDFTMLTTAPGPDVAPIHDRQPVVLSPADWAPWLDLSKPESDLLKPSPAGAFAVQAEARAGELF